MRFIRIQLAKLLGFNDYRPGRGPLANPLDLETQLMGLYRVELQGYLLIRQQLGRKRAVIITGPDNMDEAALYGTSTYTLWKMVTSQSAHSLMSWV